MIIKTKCIYCGKEEEIEIVDITNWKPGICDECLEKLSDPIEEVN